jgi:hypothetical protein
MHLDIETQILTDRSLDERAAQLSTTTLPPRLLDERAAAKLLDVSPALMRKMRRLGIGPVVIHIGRLVRYAEADLLAFINANRRDAA